VSDIRACEGGHVGGGRLVDRHRCR